MANEAAAIERHGVADGARLGFRLQAAVLRAFRGGQNPLAPVWELIAAAVPLLRSALTAGHLSGLRRLSVEARRGGVRGLRLQRGGDAILQRIEFLRRQLELTEQAVAAIDATYAVEAAKVLEVTGGNLTVGLQREILAIQQEGLTLRNGVKRLRGQFTKFGITPRNSFTLENIFRTEIQKSYSAGRWAANQRPEIDEILVAYKYVTVGDARVRPEHAALDGVVLPKDDPAWDFLFPPNGFSCRCQAIEVFDDRPIVAPPAEFTTTVRGKSVTVRPGPDPGFDMNFGKVFQPV